MNQPANGEHPARVRSALDEFEGPLLRYAQRITGDVERARDVVQETFLRLWKEDAAELDGRLPQWLFTVCRNLALDVRRKEQRMTSLAELTHPRDFQKSLGCSEDPPPDETAATADAAEQVAGWLNRLPANQQEVIRLKFQNGLKYKQIAEITGLSVTNVGFLIHKGIAALREKARLHMAE